MLYLIIIGLLLFNRNFFIMKLLKVYSISFLFLFSIFFANPIFAEEKVMSEVIHPSVNIYQAKIISQDKNNINISFNIVNEDYALSGLKYSIELVKKTSLSQSVSDSYISSETINLSPKEVLSKSIEYTTSSVLNGDYDVFVYVKDSNGLVLGLGSAGNVKLTSSVGVEVLPETCYLSVSKDSKYQLNQGVDILNTEDLILNCTILNHSKNNVSVAPSYETHYRTIYGDIIEADGGDNNSISINAGEKKVVSIKLPKAKKPQAYDVKVSFKDKDIVSNSIIAHYVIRGASATISNFSLDKDGYAVGDKANIFLSWASSADSFPGNRFGVGSSLSQVFANISILNSEGKECISPINQSISKDNSNILNLNKRIKTNCKDPKVTVELKDESGNILDQKVLSFETKSELINNSYLSNKDTLIIIFGILLVTGIALYFISLKKKQNETIN